MINTNYLKKQKAILPFLSRTLKWHWKNPLSMSEFICRFSCKNWVSCQMNFVVGVINTKILTLAKVYKAPCILFPRRPWSETHFVKARKEMGDYTVAPPPGGESRGERFIHYVLKTFSRYAPAIIPKKHPPLFYVLLCSSLPSKTRSRTT